MTIHTNHIAIDEVKFKKAAKKLLSKIKAEENTTFKLNNVQEMLAQSLGYRNLFELNEHFSKKSDYPTFAENKRNTDKYILQNLNYSETVRMLKILSLNNDFDHDYLSGFNKIVACLYLLSFLQKESPESLPDEEFYKQDFSLTYENISSNISDLFVFTMQKNIENIISKTPASFFETMPYFKDIVRDIGDQRMVSPAMKKHFESVYQNLYYIQKYDFEIFHIEWLSVKDPNDYKFKNYLYSSPYFELSWLEMKSYNCIVIDSLRTHSNKIMLSDLIFKIVKTINPQKRESLEYFYDQIMLNKNLAREISLDFVAKTKEYGQEK